MRGLGGAIETAAAWDHIWSSHSYRLARVRSTRAKIKVAAATAIGMKFEAGDRVLDIACGSGDNLIEAAAQIDGDARIFALDISGVALALARKNFERVRLDTQLLRADWRGLPFRNGSFDKVMAFMAPFPAVIGEIERVLRPGGKLFMVALSRDSVTSFLYRIRESIFPGPFDDSRNYSRRELISVIGDSLAVEDWRTLHSGSERPFSGAVDRALGRWIPDWGRYIVLRCAKVAITRPSTL
jgi:ubiquinone/menaquinone biosynthesis C-methylase UbiE